MASRSSPKDLQQPPLAAAPWNQMPPAYAAMYAGYGFNPLMQAMQQQQGQQVPGMIVTENTVHTVSNTMTC